MDGQQSKKKVIILYYMILYYRSFFLAFDSVEAKFDNCKLKISNYNSDKYLILTIKNKIKKLWPELTQH